MFGHKQPDKTASYRGGFESPDVEPVVDENVRQEIDPDSGVKRGLKNRHLSMMALAGIIGPGLLVGSGGALENGGPASLIVGFGVIGIIAFSIMQSLGEVTTLYPGGGAFISLAERFVDKGFAVAVGWVSAISPLEDIGLMHSELFHHLGCCLVERVQRHHQYLCLLERQDSTLGLLPDFLDRIHGLSAHRRRGIRRSGVLVGSHKTSRAHGVLHIRHYLRLWWTGRTRPCSWIQILA